MLVEGVTFVESSVKKTTKRDFVKAHKDVLWLDREPKEREKMLSDVYDTITGQKKEKEQE
ncbi:MAG: hypothetical protein IJ606_01805 [Bacteroidaceae bacterium]|nr:hypothetical protein [Bacteroidaceae bacterium]